MVLLILNEAVLFASLVASYFYLRFNSPGWPQDGLERPELALPIIGTILLVASSFVMSWGEGGIRKGNVGRLRTGLAGAFILGAVFLGVQLFEYTRTPFRPSDNVYASLFFAITGIHALHVTLGLLMNAFTQVRAGLGHFDAAHYQTVENIALYWHFVDLVWLVIFASLYLSPYV
jgi:heme/copper-type cytochrome/quinol oxidase subunit 3